MADSIAPPPTPGFKRIVVPLSCAPDAPDDALVLGSADRHTFDQALWLAARFGADMLLVHVVDFLDARRAPSGKDVEQHARDVLLPQLMVLKDAARALEVNAAVTIQGGRAYYQVLRTAHEFDADLIMMSPRRTKLRFGDHLIYGSTSRRVIRQASCPVWIVGSQSEARVQGVLALIDRSEVSAKVIAMAGAVATAAEAKRGVLHCPEYPDDVALRRLPHAQKVIRAHHKSVRAAARADIDGWTHGEPWQLYIDDEWVVRAAPRLIEEQDYDLLVLANVSYPLLRGVLLGTTAERLIERTHASALIVRPDAWSSSLTFEET